MEEQRSFESLDSSATQPRFLRIVSDSRLFACPEGAGLMGPRWGCEAPTSCPRCEDEMPLGKDENEMSNNQGDLDLPRTMMELVSLRRSKTAGASNDADFWWDDL